MVARSSGIRSSTVARHDLRHPLQAVAQHRLDLVERPGAGRSAAVTSCRSRARAAASASRSCALSRSVTSRTQPIVPVGLPAASMVTLPCASIQRSVPSGQKIRLRRTYDDRASTASWTTAHHLRRGRRGGRCPATPRRCRRSRPAACRRSPRAARPRPSRRWPCPSASCRAGPPRGPAGGAARWRPPPPRRAGSRSCPRPPPRRRTRCRRRSRTGVADTAASEGGAVGAPHGEVAAPGRPGEHRREVEGRSWVRARRAAPDVATEQLGVDGGVDLGRRPR